ncbi:hypothetical protein EST24_05730 [Pasteurella multocida subsp. multocida]|nr:hypothetical protein [Pasteurella multocida]RXH44061.1 hypothetical protein EST24_05730 [Pasteurella multocida subsp. multocida]NKD98888.1 hypothetical protein [Pasteurella multocida]NKG40298.1 hypothetical protein [Pasteurella multocida]NKG42445.1 hypothetical protein [Pasteurella multocida]
MSSFIHQIKSPIPPIFTQINTGLLQYTVFVRFHLYGAKVVQKNERLFVPISVFLCSPLTKNT